jgi:hypothetical protein
MASVDDPAFAPSAFSYFRVLMTGKNSHSHWYLALSGFELYGDLWWSALPSESRRPSPEAAATSLVSSASAAAAAASVALEAVEEISASGAPLRWCTFTPAFASALQPATGGGGPLVVSSAELDTCGLLYWLGVQGDAAAHAWDNPAGPAGLNAVRVAFAPALQGAYDCHGFLFCNAASASIRVA